MPSQSIRNPVRRQRPLNRSNPSTNIPKKQIWVGAFFSLVSILFWFGIFWALSSRITDALILIGLLLLGIFWIAALVITILFLDKKIVYSSFGVLLLTLLVLFSSRDFNIIGIILFSILLVLAYLRAESIKKSLAKFKSLFIARRFFTIFFTGLALLLAFVYNSFILTDYLDGDFNIPPNVYHILFIPIETSLIIAIPEYQRQ